MDATVLLIMFILILVIAGGGAYYYTKNKQSSTTSASQAVATGPAATGPAATGPVATGPVATGPAATGPVETGTSSAPPPIAPTQQPVVTPGQTLGELKTITSEINKNIPSQTFIVSTSSLGQSTDPRILKTKGYFPVQKYMVSLSSQYGKSVEDCQKGCDEMGCVGWQLDNGICSYNDINRQPNNEFNDYWSGINILRDDERTIPSLIIQGNLVDDNVNLDYFPGYTKTEVSKVADAGECQLNCAIQKSYCNVWTYSNANQDCTYYQSNSATVNNQSVYKKPDAIYGLARTHASDPLLTYTKNYHTAGIGRLCDDTYSCANDLSCRPIGTSKKCLQAAGTVQHKQVCVDNSECIQGLSCNYPKGMTSGNKYCNLGVKIGEVLEGEDCYGDSDNCKYPTAFTCGTDKKCMRQPHVLPAGRSMTQSESLNFKGIDNGDTSKLFFKKNGTLEFTSDSVGVSGFSLVPVTVINGEESPQNFKITAMENGDLKFSIYDPTVKNIQKSEVMLWTLKPTTSLAIGDKPARYEISNTDLFLKKSNGTTVFRYPTDNTLYKIDVFSENDLKVYYNTSISETINQKIITVSATDGADKLRDLMVSYGATAGSMSGTGVKLYFKTDTNIILTSNVVNVTTIVRNYRNVTNLEKGAACMHKDNCADNRDCLVMNTQDGTQRCYTRAECAKTAHEANAQPETACKLVTNSQENCTAGYDCISGVCSTASKRCIAGTGSCITNSDCTGNLGVCNSGTCVGQPLGSPCVVGSNDCFTGLKCSTGKSNKCIANTEDACYDNSDCTGYNKFCDPVLKVCKQTPIGENCTSSVDCGSSMCAASTKKCIASGTCLTSADCSGGTNWCDSASKTCKAPMDVYLGGEMHMNDNIDVTCLISQNGKWALVLKNDTDLVVIPRDESTGALDKTSVKWHSWTQTTDKPLNMLKARLRFDPNIGGLNVDYYNTLRNTWIQIFEQISSGIYHNDWNGYTPLKPYSLKLTNDGDLNIIDKFGSIHWSSTGTSYYGKSFHALRQIGHDVGVWGQNWIDFPNINDYPASIGQLMNTVNGTPSAIGFTVDFRPDGKWKYKIIETSGGNMFPNTTGHTYMKNQKDNRSRVNYYEYDNNPFEYSNGRNAEANVLEYQGGIAQADICANKTIVNGLSRGFQYDPNNGDCWVLGDSVAPQWATNYTYPMPTGFQAGYTVGWKNTQGPKSSAQSPAYIQKLESPNGQCFMQCEDHGEIYIKNGDNLIYSTQMRAHTGCKLVLENRKLWVRSGTGRCVWRSSYTDYSDNVKILTLDDDGLLSYKEKTTGVVVWTQNMEINSVTTTDWVEITNMQNGNAYLCMHGDGNLVTYVKRFFGSYFVDYALVFRSNTYGNPEARTYLFKNLFVVRNEGASGFPWLWVNIRGDNYYSANPACLYLNTDGQLDIYPNSKNDPNKIWSSWTWAPRNLHVGKGKATGSRMFRIQAVFLSGTTTVSQNNQCLGVPGGYGDHTPVNFYNDTTTLTDLALWKLYPVLDDAGSNGQYYIVLANNTNFGLHRWADNDNDVCLRLLSQDMGNNSRWSIAWDTGNDQTCRIRAATNLNKSLYWTDSNVNGTRAKMVSGTGGTFNFSW